MSTVPPTHNSEYEDSGKIEVLLEWVRQDINGILEQMKVTNGRMRKAEDAVHDLQVDNNSNKDKINMFSKAVEEWTVLKGQILIIKNIGIFIALLQVVGIILSRL